MTDINVDGPSEYAFYRKERRRNRPRRKLECVLGGIPVRDNGMEREPKTAETCARITCIGRILYDRVGTNPSGIEGVEASDGQVDSRYPRDVFELDAIPRPPDGMIGEGVRLLLPKLL